MEPFSLDAGAFCWINGEADDPEAVSYTHLTLPTN